MAFNRHLPVQTLMLRPHLYRAHADWDRLNVSTVALWVVRALYQAGITYALVDNIVSPSLYVSGQTATYAEVAVASFSIYLMIQCGNLCLETTTFTAVQVLALGFGIMGSVVLYTLCNNIVGAHKLVDYHAVFHIWTSPATLLVAPLATAAALVPVAALKFAGTPQHAQRLDRDKTRDKDKASAAAALERDRGGALSGVV